MSNSFDYEPSIIPSTKEEYIKNGNRFLSLEEFFSKPINEPTNKTVARKSDTLTPKD